MTEKKKAKIAWSDDLSYDSEEEREKERIALAELAEIETPEKPTYSDEELNKLVHYIQQLTTLYCLRDDDWNNDCINIIKEFFMEPKCLLLIIFFHNNKLVAMLCIPDIPVYDLTYFSREPDMIFTVDNFHDEIVFGTFVESVEESLLKMLEYVYAPVFFAAPDWPEGVKSEFCTHLHSFLAKSTDLHYKMLGLTVIYIPREGLELSVEDASANRELVKRLESVVVHWTHQMKSCIEDHDTAESQRELVCPPDEYEFWVYRYENLNSVNYQIKNKCVEHIAKILIDTHSSYIKQFQKLCYQITESMVEAKSNIEYLQIIEKPCVAMEVAKDLNELPQYISTILNTFRYIWLQSPYYNTPSRLINLCNSLSNQVILQCSESINLKALFSGKTRASIEEFRKCIECCKTYREIYDSVADAHNDLMPGSWNLDKSIIFNYIDSFVQRCVDMLEVCNCMIIFGRIDEVEDIPIPRFGGTRGEEFEKICEKVEKSFLCALLKIENGQDNILDVQVTSWYENILEFNATTKHIEVLIENLLSSVFETINNVEEGVQVLCSMYNYSKRINLRRIFEQKTSEVWNIFSKEIGDIKRDLVAERSHFPAGIPAYAGQATMAYMRNNRLIYLKKIMDSAAWMLPCSNAEDTINQQQNLVEAIEITIQNIWTSWANTEPTDIIMRLDKALLCESSHHDLISCNIDRSILETCCEARHWQNIEWEVPPHFVKINSKMTDVRYTYENMLILIQGYNRILMSLSSDERKLFKPLINTCMKTIKPGFKKLQWTSPMLDTYIVNCKKNIDELQDFLDCYKLCNQNIVKLLEKICGTPMVKLKIFNVFDLDDLQSELKCMWDNTIEKLLAMYKEIITYLIIIYEGFEKHIEEIPSHWLNYVGKYDLLLGNAFLLNVKTSMQNMLWNVSGDGTVLPQPLLNMKTVLRNSEICYVPAHAEVMTTFSSISSNMIELIHRIPRLLARFGLPTMFEDFGIIINNDNECRRLNDLIIEETVNALEMVTSNVKTWDSYKHIWEVPKDEFLNDYVLQNPTARDFDKDITRYGDLGNDAQMQDNITQVHFIVLNYLSLKTSIDELCEEWQTKFEKKLKGLSQKNISAIYKYIKTSSKAAMRHPSNLVEFQELIESYDRLCSEILHNEKRISTVKDQMDILVKYNVMSPQDVKRDFENLSQSWSDYLALLEDMKVSLNSDVDHFKTNYLDQSEQFTKIAQNLLEIFSSKIPKAADVTSKIAFATINLIKKQVEEMRKKEREIREGLLTFKINLPVNQDLTKIDSEIKILEEVWKMVEEWETAWESYRSCSFWTLEREVVEDNVQKLFRTSNRLSRQLKDRSWEIIDCTRGKIDAFRRTIPLLGDLKNSSMRERHWHRIKSLMNSDFDQNSESFKLEAIIALNFQAYAEEISEISTAATMELNIENGLKAIEDVWTSTKFDMEIHRENIYRIKSADECSQFLEDHQIQLSAMKSTKFVEPFINDVEYWEKTLGGISETLEVALQVQRRWLYLENIFLGDDIRKQLPDETEQFNQLSAEWESIMCKLYEGKNALDACLYKPFPFLLNQLNGMIAKLDSIQRTLEKYLETKRKIFPRFYFISNDDLLEILGNSKKPWLVQMHLKKLFDNFNKMKLEKISSGSFHARGMISADGEILEWKQPIILEGPAESWLSKLEDNMQSILKQVLIQTRLALKKAGIERENWINEWPGQLVITSSKIQWTADCTRCLMQCALTGDRKPLKRLRKKENNILQTLLMMSRKDIPKILRLKVNALSVIEIHSRDVVDKLYKSNCTDVSAFEWFSQLKFYWERENSKCVIRQTNTMFYYTYEYIGNSGRLVITPLTDRCYITLTTALNLFRGGSPQGPAGTGKTETVKDLGRAMARWVVVTNCSDGLDYKSMAKCFAGIAQSGCWGCFDEFNRINIEVLSVVAQQILSILIALSQGLQTFMFEGTEIKLVNSCGIFITMNPGYAGRTELPDNLKSMFRPISMCVPDNLIIAENTLFSDGFQDYKSNAKKVFTLYELAKRQLSNQHHYDFGLRSMVALLRYAGVKRRNYPNLPEQEIIILAMRDMNFARLTAKDVPLFDGIIKDIFPDSQSPLLDYNIIHNAITAEMRLAGLQPIPIALQKVIQVMETKNSRHSTMILGDTNTAKSVTWRTLMATLTSLKSLPEYEAVHYYPINPKALTLAELYGEYNLSTAEWADGVISSIMRTVCQEETPDQKWIVFDGPVDAVWIENLNSVMDDNKLLTLINSERISMPPMVSLLFESRDLSVASPATVSRCGMVYNDYKDWRWKPFVNSWLETVKEPDYREDLRILFEKYLEITLEFKRVHLKEGSGVEGQELTGVRSLCRLMTVFAPSSPTLAGSANDNDVCEYQNKTWFLFCLIWSIGAVLDADSQKKFDVWLREVEGIFPIKGTVYDYYVDPKRRQFIAWEENLSDAWRYNVELGFHSILVPTVESLRIQHISAFLIKAGYGFILGGPSGAGKTSLIQGVLNNSDNYSKLIINMSAQTTSSSVQDTIEGRLEKRNKGNYMPFGGKKMISFLDDMNMPARDEYGSQPPLELVRQWLDYAFWYDRDKQTKKYVREMIVVGAVGPPGGARSPLPPRLLSQFHCFYLPSPSRPQLLNIFGTMISQHFVDFDEETKVIAKISLEATIDIFNRAVAKLLPTPKKIHYLFNLRDISKVFQGMLRSNKDYQNTKTSLLRLWIHETLRVFYDRLVDEADRNWFVNIANETLEKYFDVTYHSLCLERQPPVFGDFINPFKVYEEISDREVLRNFIERQLEEYNSSAGVVRMDLVLFKDAIEHVTRIVRVISQQRGNMLLIGIGGSGRQSLTRLASYICEYSTFQVVIGKNYGSKEFREDLKRLYTSTGVDGKPTTFLFSDTQIVDEDSTEVVNNLLSSGEITNLFKADEFEDIKNRLEKHMRRANIVQTTENVYLFLVNRVRENLHIVVCMSPIGDIFRSRLRQYPALINCTTTDWFLEWPREALLEVAFKFLTGFSLISYITEEKLSMRKVSQDLSLELKLKSSVASVMSIIHSSVSQFSLKMLYESKRTNYVTPTNYLELVSGYKNMLTNKRAETAASANKLRNGLSKLEDTTVSVESMSIELEAAKAQVALFTEQCLDYMGAINIQQRNADEQKRNVAVRSVKTEEEEVQCKKLANAAMEDLAGAMPALEEAVAALNTLNKKDITEIKSYANPPAKIAMVLEAVMILLQVDTSWIEAKRQLSDQYFLENLRNFDKDHVPDKVLKRIGAYVVNPEFEPEKVGSVSSAAKSLCLWVRAIEKYGKAFKIVKPKKDKLDEAMSSLKLKQQILSEAQEKLKELSNMLESLQKEYDDKLEQKEELAKKAKALQAKLDRAASLIEGLGGERERWINTVRSLDAQFINLPGDCLIATAFISYLGPFSSHYRESLSELWGSEVVKEDIPFSLGMSVKSFLLDDAVLREWNRMGLPGDLFSAENSIIVTHAKRWPLAVDPQGQAIIWISKMEKKNGIEVTDFGEAECFKTLEKCLTRGLPVLIQNTDETIDPSINPILNKAFVRVGNRVLITFNQHVVDFHDDFRLYLATKLGNPTYTPEILTKTAMVNFAVKEQGLQAQLLGIVVMKEVPQLEQMKDDLVVTIARNRKILVDLENELLRLMNESKGSLLDNEELFSTLQTSQKTSAEVKEALETSQLTEKDIDIARLGYVPTAERASVLFFVLIDLSHIDPMYQFSLEAYIDLFECSISNSKKSDILEERINYLNEYHTYAVYKNTCRALFERHKLVFAFHLVAKIMHQKGKLNMNEYLFLLKGGIVLDKTEQPDNPTAWLPENCWDNITELNKIAGFHGVIESFEAHSRDWQSWYLHPEPETQPLVGEWNGICNDFQRLLFLRSLRMDRLTSCLITFIISSMGPKYLEPPVLDIKAAWEESQKKRPLLFVLSPGVDPTSSLIQLASDCKMSDRFQSLSLGQGQSGIATRMLEKGMEEGGWVFLANCHLACGWLSTLRDLDNELVHSKFRLWLSSMPDPSFPLTVLQKSIKMTTEPPQGLKGNMALLFSNINEEKFLEGSQKYRKLLYCVSFFHCTLIARKRFRQLGYNVVYSFNRADFEASENLLSLYLEQFDQIPFETLKYLFAVINYGGHVTDDWDMRVLNAYINQIFCPDALNVNLYKLCPVSNYHVPRDGSLHTYKIFIEMLPTLERAESVGQHASADVACLTQDANLICDALLSLKQTGGGADNSGRDQKVSSLANEMLLKLPKVIDIETAEALMGMNAVMPICVSLLQELVYFNELIVYIVRGLEELKKAIEGLVIMSEELEEMYLCIFEGKVPNSWMKARPSVKPLGSWCRELSARGSHLDSWAKAPRSPPTLCWLPSFNSPTGFLTAVMQTTARQEGWPIDTICWEFTVMDLDESSILKPPADGGVYIRGLFLEGANWLKKDMHLSEPQAMQLVCPMNPIRFKPIQMGGKKSKGKYTCPTYYYPLRKGAFVVSVDLPAGRQDADFWIKTGTALLCTLGAKLSDEVKIHYCYKTYSPMTINPSILDRFLSKQFVKEELHTIRFE